MTNKHLSAFAAGAVPAQIISNSPGNIRRQRHLRPSLGFAPNPHACIFPVNVFQSEPDGFARPQSQSCHYKQDGIIPSPHRIAPVAMPQQFPHLAGCKMFWQSRTRPLRHLGNNKREIGLNLPLVKQITQNGSRPADEGVGG